MSVMAQHLLEHFSTTSYFNFGRFGVLLFFLISGFVVPFSIKGERPIRRFVISRFFRLYPAYWVSLGAAALIMPLAPPVLWANLSMLQYLFGQPDAVGVYWSLFFELVFYAICVPLFLTGALFKARDLTLICIWLLLASVILTRLYLPGEDGAQFLAFMVAGAVYRRSFLEGDDGKWAFRITTALLVAVIMNSGLIYAVAPNRAAFFPPMALGMAGIAAIGVFVLIAVRRWSLPILEWLGGISYSIYLFHAVALAGMTTFYPHAGPWLLLIGPATIVTSWLCYRFVEQPFIEFGRRFTHQRHPAAI